MKVANDQKQQKLCLSIKKVLAVLESFTEHLNHFNGTLKNIYKVHIFILFYTLLGLNIIHNMLIFI